MIWFFALLVRAAPLLFVPVRGSVLLFPAFGDVPRHSNAAGYPDASATATGGSNPRRNSCSTTACRDPSTFLLELRSAEKLLPVAPAPALLGYCRWRPAQSDSGFGHRARTTVP